MKKWSLFFSVALLLFNCTPATPDDPECNANPVANIHLTDPQPDLYATSVSYLTSDSFPANQDSTAYIEIDVDQDSINDFKFSVKHYYEYLWTTPSTQYKNYGYSISVESFNADDKIITTAVPVTEVNNTIDYVDYADFNQLIGYSSNFSNSDLCMLLTKPLVGPNVPYAPYSHDMPSEAYIGFKIVRDNNTYFGWIKAGGNKNELYIKSWAMDHTPGNCTGAGVY